MSHISERDVEALAALSRISLSAEKSKTLATQLESVVSYIDELKKVDTSCNKEWRGITGTQNILRSDELLKEEALDKDALFAGFPARHNDFIRVRAVLSGQEESA